MSQTSSAPADGRRRPARLVAYYLLLFLFIILVDVLLEELASRYDFKQFEKVGQIVALAFNHTSAFDDVVHTVFSLFLSLVFTLPLAWVYTLTKDEEEFDPSLVQTLVVLSMAVTGVMIVIGTELARAFSLAGVVAAVRFRNTLDDAKDTVYVFLAIAIGMACGAKAYPIAVWMSLIMTATMYALWKYRFGRLMGVSSGGSASRTLEGKKGKKVEALQWIRDETTAQRAQHALEQQVRMLQWASLPSKDKKKATCALMVDASDLGAAQRHVDAALGSIGGKWRLAGVSSNGGHGVLEYVGRPPKEMTPAALVAAVRRGAPDAIEAIEFRSLKGLMPPLLALPPAGGRADEDDGERPRER